MKYDFLILSSLPKNSGCYLRAKYLAHSLENNGANVKFITPCKSKPFMMDFLINFIKYIFYTAITDFKIGIAMKPYPNTTLPLLIKKIITKNEIIVDIDDIDFGYRKGAISSFSRIIQKPFPKYFDMVTFHNALLKNFIINEYNVLPEKLFNLPQGVDFNIFNSEIDVKKFKEFFLNEKKLDKDTKILVYPAHLNIASDLDIILNNIKEILEKKNTFLIIAGGGPLLNFFINLAKNLDLKKIFFTGYLTPEKIVKYILISDLALVYYKDTDVNYYRSSMKLRECLALKKKVICNNIGELKLFENFTYQSEKDINSFMGLLDKILTDFPYDNREIKAYEFIKKNFDWDGLGKKFVESIACSYNIS